MTTWWARWLEAAAGLLSVCCGWRSVNHTSMRCRALFEADNSFSCLLHLSPTHTQVMYTQTQPQPPVGRVCRRLFSSTETECTCLYGRQESCCWPACTQKRSRPYKSDVSSQQCIYRGNNCPLWHVVSNDMGLSKNSSTSLIITIRGRGKGFLQFFTLAVSFHIGNLITTTSAPKSHLKGDRSVFFSNATWRTAEDCEHVTTAGKI